MVKKKKTLVEERWKTILDILRAESSVTVEALAKRLEVSRMTIRRDLAHLESKKFLKRVHGGAKFIFNEKDENNLYRTKIAKLASGFLDEGDTLFINTSSNAVQIIDYIKNKHITIITNNGKAIYRERDNSVDVILTGGELRGQKDAMVGDFALRNLSSFYAKKAFLGCSGLSAKGGVTTEVFPEVNINEMMIEHTTQKVFILADHTKIGRNSSFMSVPIEKIHAVITDEKADPKALDAIRKKGIEVYQVKKYE